jgi:hypothetical protein
MLNIPDINIFHLRNKMVLLVIRLSKIFFAKLIGKQDDFVEIFIRKVLIGLNPKLLDYDYLWKDVITDLFEEFLLFFSPTLYEQVDFTSPSQFLEQELQTILPASESNNRVAE